MNSNVSKYIIPFSIVVLIMNIIMVGFVYLHDNTNLFDDDTITIQTQEGELVINESDLIPTSFPTSFAE